MNLNELGAVGRQIALDHGFDHPLPEQLMLIVTEVSEAMEAYRDGNIHGIHGVGEELADVIIRTVNLASQLGVDLDRCVQHKTEKNRNRPFKHGRQH